MILDTIIQYKNIVIQCHNNPDADTIASGFALYSYLRSIGKTARLIYSGIQIQKPNLKIMIKQLAIPLEFVTKLEPPDLLVTVDCHYNNNNLTRFSAHAVCIIDHHIIQGTEFELQDIRPYLGSCATLLWDLLTQANFDFNAHPNVATALYYGLLTDTNYLSETRHPLDRDMADSISYDSALIHNLKHSNLSFNDLETAGNALINCSLDTIGKVAIFESRPCDPNILGFISDLAIQVENISLCIVYFQNEEGIKFSLRSCTKEVKANEFANYLTSHVGSGGGHLDKAGGFIDQEAFVKTYSTLSPNAYFHNVIKTYFHSFDIIHTG
ncbi:DHH family phosphoesterase [Niameybacter massiliensis]|uniref:DHH family phosphoesterase n=1 Tax=Holtiella tumoricola TaxID=3018743 RepID=A0AA42DRJ3_9FIRM|nr:DHH family phosphoesterase [Holtiella tumoricola]MDA3733449.1 DHH family phosphoesterase [Holtiella tumoricola]